MKALVIPLTIMLTACANNVVVKYPASQTNNVAAPTKSSNMTVARSAYEFADKDIKVPANFDTQGIESCNFSHSNEHDACPLKKQNIRIYFGDNKILTKNDEERQVLETLTNQRLGFMLENQLAGLNRFRIVTRDNDVIDQERTAQLQEQDIDTMAQILSETTTLRPDYLIKVDTVKTAERFYAEYNGVARYNIEMTSSVIDPFTKEKLSSPNIGKIRVKGTDIRDKEFFVYSEVNNKYYTGFNYTDKENISAVFSSMASKAFDVMLSRLLTEMPSSAQVLGFKNSQITLDRGRNAGILTNETMIIFNYELGFVEPIAVAVVTPSKNSAVAQIVRWKNNDLAKSIKKAAKNKIHRPASNQKVFAVSVGLPENYLENRL